MDDESYDKGVADGLASAAQALLGGMAEHGDAVLLPESLENLAQALIEAAVERFEAAGEPGLERNYHHIRPFYRN